MLSFNVSTTPTRWELAAETIAVKIRWFGLLVGCLLVNIRGPGGAPQLLLNAILGLGGLYAILDTYYSMRGRIFLGRYPLCISFMESLFIGLLCAYYGGPESPFRYYYLLSLICCAIRHSSRVTFATYALHANSFTLLYLALPAGNFRPLDLALTLIMLGWATWASDALATLLKHVGEHLVRLNAALQEQQALLEARISERTRDLQEAQARLLHQEKMAAFGLLAAGIAHEVGNPLTSISAIVQMLQRRDADAYTHEKLSLVSDQLLRIRGTLRELINFSRPASPERTRVSLAEIIDEALNIAKYYQRTKGRVLEPRIPEHLPPLYGIRDQLVQVFLNLVLNAIDATEKGGRVELTAQVNDGCLAVIIRDDGKGIGPLDAPKIFQPYFTTKKNGTGLGLFVTQKLVVDHGGVVAFRSNPGSGTEFCVRLPLAAEAATSETALVPEGTPLLQRVVT
ncbi:MAG TPA: ATP-binding protein [Gemmataceae bacterium]|jgi:signal transduction histidine kinase|nr:ATP-binding protein [Gemmataceae bacterium]